MNSRQKLTPLHSLDEIPAFASEHEEWEFWETHELSDKLWDSLPKTKDDFAGLTSTKRAPRTEVQSWEEVPEFGTESEEREWWQNRVPSPALLDSLPDRPIKPTRLETLRGFVKLGRSQASHKAK